MLEDISGEQIKEQFKSNKTLRMVTMIVGGLIVLVLAYFGYRQFIWEPANEKSKDATWIGLNYADKDSTELAIDEFRVQVKKYDGKIGGEIAQFSLARQYMNSGEFKKAIEELEGVDVSDTYVQVMAIGLRADAYSELENYTEAASLYLEAANLNANEFTSPIYLMKAGLNLEEINNFEKATECYKQIKEEYPTFASQKAIDKYIARTENNKTK
ncbi:MAG: hypothetical protein COA33_008405 [Fluviicola sp.]|nr:hypothetical protein [Fluviicola sp.]